MDGPLLVRQGPNVDADAGRQISVLPFRISHSGHARLVALNKEEGRRAACSGRLSSFHHQQ